MGLGGREASDRDWEFRARARANASVGTLRGGGRTEGHPLMLRTDPEMRWNQSFLPRGEATFP